MARRIQIGGIGANLKMADGMHDLIERAIERGYKEIADGLEAEAKRIYDNAYAAWPVKTGRSKAALRYSLRYHPPRKLTASVYVDPTSEAAKYVYYIKTVNHPNGKSVWVSLVRSPATKSARELAKSLGIRYRYSIGQGGRMKRGR